MAARGVIGSSALVHFFASMLICDRLRAAMDAISNRFGQSAHEGVTVGQRFPEKMLPM